MFECEHPTTHKEAQAYSDAVFIGEVIKRKKEVAHLRTGEFVELWDTKFKVVKSWKLINANEVWVSTGEQFECSKIEIGKKYLVYGTNVSHLSSDVPISAGRTVSEDNKLLFDSEIKELGVKTLTLSNREFYDYHTQLTYLSVAILIILLVFLASFLWIRKKEI